MTTVIRQNVTNIDNNTKYIACAFYIDEIYDKNDCFFDNCSFRKNLEINYSSCFSFLNCSFHTLKIGYGVKKIDINARVEILRLFEQGIQCVQKIKFLRSLELIGSMYASVAKEQWQSLQQVSNLKELSLRKTGIRNKTFRYLLTQVPFIEKLIFKSEDVNKTGLAGIRYLTELKKLTFFKSKMRKEHLKYIENLDFLEELYIGDNTSKDISYVTTLPKLTKLSLPKTKVDSQNLKHIRELNNLKHLNLEKSLVTDEGLKYLSNCSNIQVLNLSHLAGVSDKGLKYIKHLPKLQSLLLKGTKITDNALRYHMKDMFALRKLDLADTKISDYGLKYFEHLKHIEYLDICKTEICNIAQLQGILPYKCKIKYTDDDWQTREIRGLAT